MSIFFIIYFFFASLEIDWLFALSLLETFVFFQLIPCQSTYCHDLTVGTIQHNYPFQAYAIGSVFIHTRIPKERKLYKNLLIAGERASILQSKVSVTLVKSNYFMQKSSESINISGEDEEKRRTSANNYARAVRQRTFYQEARSLSYLYSSQISKVTETTRL